MFQFSFRGYDSKEKNHSLVICLAGRGGDGGRLARDHKMFSGLTKTSFVGVTPYHLCFDKRYGKYQAIEWYNQPYSADDQREAVAGLEEARKIIEDIIDKAGEYYGVPRERIALVGFSAGAVMSLYTSMHGAKLAGAVSHAGAILEPHRVPNNGNKTPLLLVHGKNDFCFDWYERYVPAKNALIENGYSVRTFEHMGSHWVRQPDVIVAGKFLAPLLGYEEGEFDSKLYNNVKKAHKTGLKRATVERIPRDWEPGMTQFFI